MIKRTHGFTIVELLIVIIVIGILATITIVSYRSVQVKAENATRLTAVHEWKKLFETYSARYGAFPTAPNGTYCLADTSSTNNKCGKYKLTGTLTFNSNAALSTSLSDVGEIPSTPPIPINDSVGPYVEYPTSGLSINIYNVFEGKTGTCPRGLVQTASDSAGAIICRITLLK
ncbi:MAG: prepilin-type N-terminal cleavage/methylation domain-containing protein [Candidatus Saccharimonadales bacterium]